MTEIESFEDIKNIPQAPRQTVTDPTERQEILDLIGDPGKIARSLAVKREEAKIYDPSPDRTLILGNPAVSLGEFIELTVQPVIKELAEWRAQSERDNSVIRELSYGEEIGLSILK